MQEARQIYQKLTDYWTKCCYLSLCPSLYLLRLVLPLPSWTAKFSQFLDTVLREIKRHKWSFMKYIVSFSGLKNVFSKLSLAKYHFLHKNPAFTVTSIYFISCLQLSTEANFNFMPSFTTARLYKSFSFINSFVQIFQPFSDAATTNVP